MTNPTEAKATIHKMVAIGKNIDIPRNTKNPSEIMIPTPANATTPAKHKIIHPMRIVTGIE